MYTVVKSKINFTYMKKLLLVSVLCSLLYSTYAQKTFYVDINSKSEITCGDSLQLTADLVTPVTISVLSWGYYDDGIGLQIVDKNSHAVIIEDIYIWVKLYATVDTTILLKSGSYLLKWMYGGADLRNPDISGSVGGWVLVDNLPQLEFKVDTLVDGKNVTYSWPGLGSDKSSVKIAPNETDSYKVIATYMDSIVVEDSIKVTVSPLTATADSVTVSCGNTAQLNVITNYSGSGTLSYNWTPAAGLSATNIANPLVTLKTAADYFVEIETANGCIATDTVRVSPSVISFDADICMVTVNENDKNVIVWKNEQNEAIDTFYVYRESSDQTDQFDLIGTVPGDMGIFVDTASNARVQSNKYKIAIKDICGFLTNKSPEHKTMHLTINRGIGHDWNLIWEPYEGLTVSSYRIYRGTSKANLELIGTSSGSNTTYTDETVPAGDVFYQIEVILPVECTLLKSSGSSSRSNIINSAEITTGTDNNSVTEPVLYPNPAKDKLYLKNSRTGESNVYVYDLQGNLVLNTVTDANSIDISGLKSGMYTVKVVNAGNVWIGKMVKD
jgi:hypothetical protein